MANTEAAKTHRS